VPWGSHYAAMWLQGNPEAFGLPYKNSSNLDDATRAQRDQQRNQLRQSFSAAHMIL
jgi:hypothetical protein